MLLALCVSLTQSRLENFVSQLPEGADGSPETPPTPLIQALLDNDVGRANKLLDQGVDVSESAVITPLYAAQEYIQNNKQRHAMMRRLLSLGAPADQTTADGTSPLMLAAYHGDVRSAQMLLDAGADPLRVNHMMGNSIKAARMGKHDELAEQLLEHVGESGRRHHATASAPAKVEL